MYFAAAGAGMLARLLFSFTEARILVQALEHCRLVICISKASARLSNPLTG
jgi:hypothetical protein